MSYSYLSITSREIVLFSITYIASYLLNMSYRLIVHCTVYCDYNNSSILLSDNICTLPCIEFYFFSTYIAIHRKQPYKRIRLPDYLLDNSMLHDIVVMHMVNMYLWKVAVIVQLPRNFYNNYVQNFLMTLLLESAMHYYYL